MAEKNETIAGYFVLSNRKQIFVYKQKKFKYILFISKNSWSKIDQEPARFENCVASHLLKLVHFLQDYEGYKAQLYYLRSIEKKEVEFLVTIDKKPWFAVEAKINDINPSPHLYVINKFIAR